jgi:hypothetical protein
MMNNDETDDIFVLLCKKYLRVKKSVECDVESRSYPQLSVFNGTLIDTNLVDPS